MEYPYSYVHVRPDPFTAEGRALTGIGLWMRLGLIGATAVAIGVTMLINGDHGALVAVATSIAGAAVAVLAWRRAWILLDRIDRGVAKVDLPKAPADRADKRTAVRRNERIFAADWLRAEG